MRYLLGHCFPERDAFGTAWIEAWLARLRTAGFDVWPVSLRLSVPGGQLPWKQLDAYWKRGDPALMALYERVARAADGAGVLINFGGINLHPEFLRQLPTVNVLGYYDDPESTDRFARAVAPHHDLCMIGNVAALQTYRDMGVAHVRWWPCGFRADDHDAALTRDDILRGTRDIDIALLCERENPWRRRRVDQLAVAFPRGVFRGGGWPAGFLPESERLPLLQRTKIGFNVHNSTGPINFRTFWLPANGVLQICDNRAHLGHVFEPGREVIGFETIPEAIDAARYYLTHDDERRTIAAAGWERALRDYNEVACFQRLVDAVTEISVARPAANVTVIHVALAEHARNTRMPRLGYAALAPVRVPVQRGVRVLRVVARHVWRWLATARLHTGRIRNARVVRRGAGEYAVSGEKL